MSKTEVSYNGYHHDVFSGIVGRQIGYPLVTLWTEKQANPVLAYFTAWTNESKMAGYRCKMWRMVSIFLLIMFTLHILINSGKQYQDWTVEIIILPAMLFLYLLRRWYKKKVKQYEYSYKEWHTFVTNVELLEKKLNTDRSKITSERVLKEAAHDRLVSIAEAKIAANDGRDPTKDFKLHIEMEETFNICKMFGLTENDWRPYFDEAQQNIKKKEGVPPSH